MDIESSAFYAHEDWTLDKDHRESTTLIKLFQQFQKWMLRSLFQVITLIDLNTLADARHPQKVNFQPGYLDRIRTTFSESVLTFLDGIHFLAFHPNAWSHWTLAGRQQRNEEVSTQFLLESGVWVDPSKKDVRLFVMLSNVMVFRQLILPDHVQLFDALFQTSLDAHPLWDAVARLDTLLFDEIMKRKTMRLTDILQDGILFSGIDWRRTSKPQSVNGYVSECLVYLVLIHSEITSILGACSSSEIMKTATSPLLNSPVAQRQAQQQHQHVLFVRMFTALLEHVLQTFLECFRQVDVFSEKGGAMQALVDVCAVQEVLKCYWEGLPSAEALLRLIHRTVSSQDGGVEVSSDRMERVHQLVSEWLHASEIEFLCFLSH